MKKTILRVLCGLLALVLVLLLVPAVLIAGGMDGTGECQRRLPLPFV